MKKILITLKVLISNILYAQDSTKVMDLDEIIISANKVEENKRFVAQQVETITAKQIQFQNTQTTADLLQNSGSVLVQKSQQGGGSPILRGFEASRVLLVIDGVRMNNLIYRAGHLQNVITIDQSMLDRVEILYGPSSTVYGSDALGGVVHFHTKTPALSDNSGSLSFKTNAFMRYGSANNEKTGHLDLNIGSQKWASLTSFTYSDFGNLKMGKRAQTLDTVWGLRRFYVERMNKKDSLVRNNDPYVQVGSAYSQYDILQKIRYQPRENAFHTLNFQFSNSSNIPRYDRLSDPNTRTVLNYAEWYYGPQKRLMAAYDGRILDLKGFFQSLNLNANYQNIGESRYTRAFDNNFLTGRVEKVQVWGSNFGLRRVRDRHDLRIGTDFQFSEVDSKASRRHVVVDTVGKASTRYPDGGNTMLTYAAYATHTWKLSDKWTLNDGLRLQNVSIKSRFIDKTFFPFPFSDYKQNNFGWSGNFGLIYNPSSQTKVSLMGTTGFRVPNVDDLGKVFDSQRGSVIVPNPNIKPEKTYSAELGFATGFTGRFTFENALYMTRFRNAIITDIFTFNGQDSIVYDGVKSRVLANQNKRIATLWGFSSHFKAKITEGVLLTGSINYTKGRINNADGKTLPLDHVPPLYGRLGIQYFTKRFNTELYSNFNGWKRLDDYLLNGEDNEVYATKEGMPSWWTINFKMGYTFKNITLQAGVENIMDINYRVFASGIHAAGRNIYTTLRFGF